MHSKAEGVLINYRLFRDGKLIDSFLELANAERRLRELKNAPV